VKILHVLPALSKGGAERVAVDLANMAVTDGHAATLLVATAGKDEILPVPLDPKVLRRTIYPQSVGRLQRYMGIWGWTSANRDWLAAFDVIHCHLSFATLFGEGARRALRRIPVARRPVIVETNHGVGLDNRRIALALFAKLLGRRDAVAFMAFDSYWRDFVARHPDLLTRLIPNGVSLPQAPAQPVARIAMRERLGIPLDVPVAGTVGRMVAERRPRLYLPAFAEIDRVSGGRAHFVIGGAGPEIEPVRQMAAELGLAGRVHLPGLVTDPVELMAGLDLYLTMMVGEQAGIAALKAELEALGYWFRSKTDSEVLLHALAEWGTAALDRLNGMFAFALWDRKERTLLLARDRYGIKPLYYCAQGNRLAFASEQKAISAIPGFATPIDKRALLEYFTFQNIFTDRTLQEDVRLLPPGHFAVLDLGRASPALVVKQFWDFDFREPTTFARDEEYREELGRLFSQAVSRQLMTDVELGSYLSGGMDSGSITAVAAASFPYLKTFTCGFDLSSASGIELGFDERAKAEAMSYHFKTEHYEMVLKAGDMERCLPQLAHHLEEPRVGQSYPNFYAAKLASKFVKVVLSGAGGDEIFGGYPWRYYRAVVNDGFENYVDKYYAFWQRLANNRELKQMFARSGPTSATFRPATSFAMFSAITTTISTARKTTSITRSISSARRSFRAYPVNADTHYM